MSIRISSVSGPALKIPEDHDRVPCASGLVHVRRELTHLRLAHMAEVGTPVEHHDEHVDLTAWAVDASELHEPAVAAVEARRACGCPTR